MTGPTPRKPVILSVDDDPAVSRAVARDLRRQYGEAFRIVRAESAQDALETLNELKLRGETVAVFVADYRMPQMSGIQFLEEAMDIFPMARRVLLTAYADTNAAIDAINVVDLDHYLLKPWDPPGEKLYPVIDALIEAWRETGDRAIPHTKIIGHPYSARSSEVREFLARNRLYYTWFRADERKGRQLLDAAGLDDLTLPVVITEQGETLVAPSDAELAATLGLSTTPAEDFYDLVVIGGGPAGLAAAVYGASEGLKTVLIERTATGGQAGQSSRIENYLGFPDGLSGAQLADRARRQAEKFEAELITAAEVTRLEVDGAARTIHLSDGRAVGTRAVILAMGVEYRQLDADGCAGLTGAGVYYGAATSVAADCDDEEVLVIGGANSAGQAAMHLSRSAKSVTIVCRRTLEDSMSYYLIQQIRAQHNIRELPYTRVHQVTGSDHLERVCLENIRSGEREEHCCGRMFVLIGAEPCTDWLEQAGIARDDHGFILAGPDLRDVAGWTLDRPPHQLETSVPGVFVAGDVRSASAKRVAAAVGEGSMAVMLVHRYLAEA
ncbi:FAD-dependent oxidoreductase [Mycolicibacterium holsaticum]|jgi:thioredoxin reductase (NADPH)|uniref:Fused response regulator/thioredoxin-disulfide reductase n=1 Tax=Mycolicibacterium holsaticum TaxID=152142 RepID=A0A1E3RT20_9MYCO|nr:FAD-dependent oxidoreductase [Mycolicibacterium holsaticum]MDA4109198.1 chemotaxis protein CheY [Mycolicibacterium holsaticum DSM 44478 = JCM 12374]ODQ93055.1 fused response regulator/thioredoxin-disulfide reductase [Mycolicibacterium holsaticum]QZA11596.1 FAD-dependent oxidoreductase [Mycolicibacterium holsaticum DSM 44478 = JCM 12374]UNC10915.1 FAD-dependent oxidoreductase [Mycolicibacterium holsaticum DSM 44478 = JCM 12374]